MGGHPYWTQLLAARLSGLTPALTESSVEETVEQLLQIEERNLPHILKALDHGGPRLWSTVGQILGGTAVPFSRSDAAVAELELIGVARNERGSCAIRNNIYREALRRHSRMRDGLGAGLAERAAGPMTINIAAVRGLLEDAFTARDLWRFCQERPSFGPVLTDVRHNASVGEITDVLIEYCQKKLLFDELLSEIQSLNPRQFEKHRKRFFEH
jgi:hypothetical protein